MFLSTKKTVTTPGILLMYGMALGGMLVDSGKNFNVLADGLYQARAATQMCNSLQRVLSASKRVLFRTTTHNTTQPGLSEISHGRYCVPAVLRASISIMKSYRKEAWTRVVQATRGADPRVQPADSTLRC